MSNLGFGRVQRRKYIYIAKKDDAVWYFVNREGEKSVVKKIEHESITAIVDGLEVKEKEYEGETNWKLRVHITAGDEQYTMQTGLYTNASKGLLLGLKQAAEAGDAANPLTFVPEAGEKKTVFMNVLNAETGGKYTFEKGTWPRSEDEVNDLANDCIDLYGGVAEEEEAEVA